MRGRNYKQFLKIRGTFYKRLIVDFDLKVGDPYEIRTRVTAVKGRCPNR